jgi:N,N'-diacetyllegionaminate synthase
MSGLAQSFAVDGRLIGGGAPCYVIAEAGSNHNRDLGLARELIDVAADAGADAVKFQIYSGKTLYSSKTPRFEYLKDVADKDTQELLAEIETPRDWLPDLAAHARSRGITFFAAPFDDAAVSELDAVGVPIFKVANYELVDVHLIRRVAETGKPLILSVGMATYGEVEDALRAARDGGAMEVALLRCAAQYPAPANIMNLKAMGTMRRAFGVPVGLSDHSEGIHVPLGATGLGMDILEKHITLDRTMPGPDHPFAIEPDELRALVRGIRDIESAMGHGRLEGPTPQEAEMHRLARRSVIAARPIAKGTQITRADLTIKRPGFGIAPKHLDTVVGRVAKVDIEFDDIVTWDMV